MMFDFKQIVDSIDYYDKGNCTGFNNNYPTPGKFYCTGMQQGNIHGEKGWIKSVGYVVQVRLGVGAFGSHTVLMRHADGGLMCHENQSFYPIDEEKWLPLMKTVYPDMDMPEDEDYIKPYTLSTGQPEIGKIIDKPEGFDAKGGTPMMQITTEHEDGTKTLTIV